MCKSYWNVYSLKQRLTKSSIRLDAQCVDARVTKSLGCIGSVVDVIQDATEKKTNKAEQVRPLAAAKR